MTHRPVNLLFWTVALAVLLGGAPLSCAAAEPTGPLSAAQRLELRTLAGQLSDPRRSADTKLEAAELLLTRSYSAAADTLRKCLTDTSNRPAQIAVAEAIARVGSDDHRFVPPLMTMLTGSSGLMP